MYRVNYQSSDFSWSNMDSGVGGAKHFFSYADAIRFARVMGSIKLNWCLVKVQSSGDGTVTLAQSKGYK